MAKKYDYEFKTIIIELLQSGQNVKSVSDEYSLNASMIRKWRKSYGENSGGIEGTPENECSPLHCPRRIISFLCDRGRDSGY